MHPVEIDRCGSATEDLAIHFLENQQLSSTDQVAITFSEPSLGSAGTQRYASGMSPPPISSSCCDSFASAPCKTACWARARACITGWNAEQHSTVSVKPLAVVAKPPPIIYGAVISAGLHRLESWHGQPLTCSPLRVGFILGHQWTGEPLAEVMMALCQKEACSFTRWYAAVKGSEGSWSASEQLVHRHRGNTRNLSQHTCWFQHAQTLKPSDVPSRQADIYPLEQDHCDCQEGHMHLCGNLGDCASLPLPKM